MRPSRLLLSAASLLVVGAVMAPPTRAQVNPSTEQIIKSLSPTPAGQSTRGIRVGEKPPEVNLTVEFATGSADLTPQAVQTLSNLGQALVDPALASFKFRIEGHTDTVGSRAYNQALSTRRAASVAEYLVTTFHVDRNRVQPVGMGEDGLLVQTPDQTAEPRNRRVLVVNLGS
jgi:outer membrane protein OmpA-like peptidoglycan-associated protein